MKKTMKFTLMLLVLVMIAAGCGNNKEAESTPAATSTGPVKIKVASLIPPMTDILDIVKPLLKEDGVDMEVVILSDNVQPNEALANKEVDANFFQHVPYMEQFNASKGAKLVPVQPVYDAIYGGYSKRYKNIADLPDGATLVMANDPSNIGRSLQMFAKAGLIKLKDNVGIKATQADITENAKKFKFQEVDLLMLARMLDDADLVAMTPAYASPLGLTPKKDALITEGDDSEFTITLVAREDNKDSDAIQKLAKRISGPEVKKFLEDNYADIALPAF
ncbi:MetQ/NlpA family ABC transporter substrate-binding protein [Paenibacillus sp. HW567]|uniref:MetQ/NlpA family ABC transporter substrate-binding protein n=1 Tax=Paenibacillus sp. HW567 TaxID=1034769 RepID=UPI0003816E96|nr:MetQ/NlpA family ABC transporter substrate-binding protein [Paenibacillus sp. HW567]